MNIIKLYSFLMQAGGALADVFCILRLYISTTQQSAGMMLAYYGVLGLSDVSLASATYLTCLGVVVTPHAANCRVLTCSPNKALKLGEIPGDGQDQ